MPGHVGDVENVRQYVSYLMDVLGISNTYGVTIMDQTAEQFMDDEDGENCAAIHTFDGHWSCQLYLGSDWDTYTDRVKGESLLHEMLHVLHKPIDVVFREETQGIERSLPDRGKSDERLTSAIEKLVSRLTSIMSPDVNPYPVEFDVAPRVLLAADHF